MSTVTYVFNGETIAIVDGSNHFQSVLAIRETREALERAVEKSLVLFAQEDSIENVVEYINKWIERSSGAVSLLSIIGKDARVGVNEDKNPETGEIIRHEFYTMSIVNDLFGADVPIYTLIIDYRQKTTSIETFHDNNTVDEMMSSLGKFTQKLMTTSTKEK